MHAGTELAMLLKSAGADVNKCVVDASGQTHLHHAAAAGDFGKALLLMD